VIEFLSALLLAYHTGRVPERYIHETQAERESRIHNIAQAQIDECLQNRIPGWPLKACVALGTTITQYESGLLEEVHSGARTGPGGELCLFQLHRAVRYIPIAKYAITEAERLDSVGTDLDHTRNCVRLGMRIVRWHISRCKIKYEGGSWSTTINLFAQYHQPTTDCYPVPFKTLSDRALTYNRLMLKLPSK